MFNVLKHTKRTTMLAASLIALTCLALLLASCGGSASTPSTGNTGSTGSMQGASIPSSAQSSAHQANQKLVNSSTSPIGQQYLIKSLSVNMEVKDTRKTATDLQSWISATDPHSTAGGVNFQQNGDNQYSVSLSFSVQSTLYPQIENYLINYPAQHSGKLLNLNENVQDISNDYIDSQSQLKNLRGEQDRLLTLLSHASVIGDVLAIEQQLTNVEGQIEQIEAHLNDLNGQLTFYTISINLQPSGSSTAASAPWNFGKTWQVAFSAALAFGQILLTILIWLVTFCIYIIPLVLIVWLARRIWLNRQRATTTRHAP